jgi:hypothetical protein
VPRREYDGVSNLWRSLRFFRGGLILRGRLPADGPGQLDVAHHRLAGTLQDMVRSAATARPRRDQATLSSSRIVPGTATTLGLPEVPDIFFDRLAAGC